MKKSGTSKWVIALHYTEGHPLKDIFVNVDQVVCTGPFKDHPKHLNLKCSDGKERRCLASEFYEAAGLKR